MCHKRLRAAVALLALCVPLATSMPVQKANVLVVYADDQYDQNKGSFCATSICITCLDSKSIVAAVATQIGKGAAAEGCNVKTLEVSAANYKRDVWEFADAVIIGSGVYNGNAHPTVLEFINSFDFMVRLAPIRSTL